MAIPATIPVGFVTPTDGVQKIAEIKDHSTIVTTIPASYQANLTPTGVSMENQGIAINSGPRSYFEHTINSKTTTIEKIAIT